MAKIVFGGEGKPNQVWLDQVSERLDDCIKFFYSHWSSDDAIDYEEELSKLEILAKHRNIDFVIAKSAGTLLSLYAFDRGILRPEKALFLGTPLRWAQKRNYYGDLISLNRSIIIPVVYVQQRHDHMGSAEELKNVLGKEVNIVEGGDHWYAVSDIAEYL